MPPLPRRSSSFLGSLALAAATLALYGCPGELDPSLTGGTGGTGGSTVCDAPSMVLANTDTTKGCGDNTACHGATIHEGGLDLVSAGVIGRLLDKAPNPATSQACQSVTKAYLISNTSPAQGLLLDKLNTGTCGSPMPFPLGGLPQMQRDCLMQWATAVTTGAIQ
jgi:hypothetical protein